MARKGAGRSQGGAPPSDEGWGTHVHGTRPIAGAHPAGNTPGLAPGVSSAVSQPGQGRTWLILLVSFLVQLVVVLAAGNTFVVDRATDFGRDHDNLLGAFATLPGIYSWRLTPASGDRLNAYPAMLFGLFAFFLIAALLTLALVRGSITFWRAFVAVWLAVIAGTLANGMVRRGVADLGGDKATVVLFRGTGFEVVAGVVTGVLAGLVAAIVAVTSRRPAQAVVPLAAPEHAPYVEPEAPPPWHGDDVRPQAAAPDPYRPPREQPTLRNPQPEQTRETTSFAAVPPGGDSAESADATTRFRREDVGDYGPPTVVGRGRQNDSAPEPTTAAPVDGERAPEPPNEPTAEPAVSEPAVSEPAVSEPAPSEPAAVRTDERPPQEPTPQEPTPQEPTPQELTPQEPTTQEPTTQLRAVPRPQPSSTGGDEPTQALPTFPRPPDDEDLGHHPGDD